MSHLTDALRAATATVLMGSFAFAGTATATADPNTGSSADINMLAGSLSKGYSLNNCAPQQAPSGALAYIQCGQSPDPSGPAMGRYFLFSDGDDLAAAFKSMISDRTLTDCGDTRSPTSWHQGSVTGNGGSVACGTFQNAAEITWTTDAKNVLSLIRASNGDVPSLYQWWRTKG